MRRVSGLCLPESSSQYISPRLAARPAPLLTAARRPPNYLKNRYVWVASFLVALALAYYSAYMKDVLQ